MLGLMLLPRLPLCIDGTRIQTQQDVKAKTACQDGGDGFMERGTNMCAGAPVPASPSLFSSTLPLLTNQHHPAARQQASRCQMLAQPFGLEDR
jgi:hypothetical protein